MVVKEAVDGSLLAMCKTEQPIFQLLGLKHIADATRVLDVVRSVASGTGLPAALDITTPGHDDQPATWSTEQFYLHARGGPLADIAELLKQHKFAGDVIATMDVGVVSSMLGLTMRQNIAFVSAIKALRARLPPSMSIVFFTQLLSDALFACFLSRTLFSLSLLPHHSDITSSVFTVLLAVSSCVGVPRGSGSLWSRLLNLRQHGEEGGLVALRVM